MNDDEVTLKAETLGFKFHKHKGEWRWSIGAPDNDFIICEQGDPEGMKWLREKLTHFLEDSDVEKENRELKNSIARLRYWRDISECNCSSPLPQGGCLRCDLDKILLLGAERMSEPEVARPLPPVANSTRPVRPDPRTFQSFPPDTTCPICGTNDDGKTVLVVISGGEKGDIAEAKPMHLACAVAKQWDEGMGIAMTWPNDHHG